VSGSASREVEEMVRRNLEDIVRHAAWEAEMVRKLGEKWFEARDKWLLEAFERDREMQKDPDIRRALVQAILAKDRVKRGRQKVEGS